MAHFSNRLNILLMPTDACNMNCVYCFHKPNCVSKGDMSIEVLKQLFSISLPFYEKISFLWHGGEPMLMGSDFYETAIELQETTNNTDCQISNSMQTNLTLMTTDFAKILCENNIRISSSFDGVKNAALRGNNESILRGRQLVIEQGGRCGIIMVVSQLNIDSLVESYEFFKTNEINYTMNFYVATAGVDSTKFILREGEAINRINEFFAYWLYDKECNISVSFFEQIVDFILFQKKSVCTFTSCLGRWVGIRPDGEIVPCNRYFPSEYSFGSVFDYSDIGGAFESIGFIKLLKKAIERREKCKSCTINSFCNGGCNHVAYNENGIECNNGTSCNILKNTYLHIRNTIIDLFSRKIKDGTLNPRFERIVNKKSNLHG